MCYLTNLRRVLSRYFSPNIAALGAIIVLCFCNMTGLPDPFRKSHLQSDNIICKIYGGAGHNTLRTGDGYVCQSINRMAITVSSNDDLSPVLSGRFILYSSSWLPHWYWGNHAVLKRLCQYQCSKPVRHTGKYLSRTVCIDFVIL